MNITQLDPIEHELLFERFLNPERDSLPDIDSDVCFDRRGEVIEYIQKKYGHVAQIATFTKMGARSGIRDLGRVHGIKYKICDTAAKLIPVKAKNVDEFIDMGLNPENYYNTHGERNANQMASMSKEFSDIMVNHPELLEDIRKLDGVVKSKGVHAAGIIIAPGPIENYAPFTSSSGGAQLPVCGYDMKAVDSYGLLKLDLLGLRTVTVVHEAAKMAGIDIYNIPLDDDDVWREYRMGNTHGTFQTSNHGMTKFVKECNPSKFEDLTAIIAAYRPGPLQGLLENGNTMAEQFIINMNDESQITYDHPDLEPILSPTKGVLLYQEQCMAIAQKFAGYSLGEADLVRRAIGKKLPEEMAKIEPVFIKGCIDNGYKKEFAQYLFDMIKFFAGYSFNKSHSAAYALISYRTMYLKTKYPAEFMCAIMSSECHDLTKLAAHIKECRRLGIKVLPPDINESNARMALEPQEDGSQAIRMGLMSVKNIGEGHSVRIIANRPFKSLLEFNQKVAGKEVNKRHITNLINAGAFDEINPNRYELLNEYHFDVRNFKEVPENEEAKGEKAHRLNPDEFTEKEKLNMEKELLGTYITGHPLDYLPYKRWEFIGKREKVEIGGIIRRINKIKDKKGNDMCFFSLETIEDKRDVTVFSKTFDKYKSRIKEKAIVIVRGKKDGESIIAKEVVSGRKTAIKNKKKGKKPIDQHKPMPVKEEIDPITSFLNSYS